MQCPFYSFLWTAIYVINHFVPKCVRLYSGKFVKKKSKRNFGSNFCMMKFGRLISWISKMHFNAAESYKGLKYPKSSLKV